MGRRKGPPAGAADRGRRKERPAGAAGRGRQQKRQEGAADPRRNFNCCPGPRLGYNGPIGGRASWPDGRYLEQGFGRRRRHAPPGAMPLPEPCASQSMRLFRSHAPLGKDPPDGPRPVDGQTPPDSGPRSPVPRPARSPSRPLSVPPAIRPGRSRVGRPRPPGFWRLGRGAWRNGSGTDRLRNATVRPGWIRSGPASPPGVISAPPETLYSIFVSRIFFLTVLYSFC
jgi:hypothetical protein